MEDDRRSHEQLIAEINELRQRLGEPDSGQSSCSAGLDVPEAPSFAYFNPAPVLRFDADGTVLSINPAAAKILGGDVVEGSKLTNVLPVFAGIDFKETVEGDSHTTIQAGIGERHFQFVVLGISEFRVGHIYGSDITDRHRAEEALRAGAAEQRRRSLEQEKLSNIARIIGSSLDIQDVYQRFGEEVAGLVPFDRIVINVNADEPGSMVDIHQSSAVKVPNRAPDQAYLIEGTLSQTVMNSRRCVVFQPRDDSEVIGMYGGLVGAYGMGLRSFLSAPLLYRGEPIGCLNLHSLTENAYSERHRLLAERVAIYIAAAIANAQLYTQVTSQSEELARSNRDLEQFAHVASHDLQEPLRMVSSYVELLARRYRGELDERAEKYIHFAVDGAGRMQRLIEDLLLYSRVGTRGGELSPIESGPVVEEALANLEVAIQESDAEIVRNGLPVVMADSVQLCQLFQNLIGNSIKFKAGKPPRIEVHAERDEGEWLFSVRDDGIGFDQKYADRVFGVFKRLHRNSEIPGTGIGLAVCQRIVDRHGGRIWTEAEVGKGATFFFTLSAVSEEERG